MTSGVAGIGSALSPGRLIRAGRAEGPREETSLLAFASILLSRRRIILTSALAGTALFGVAAAADADLYQSAVSFIVRPMRSTIQVPGGASAYGISVAALQEFSQTAGFYADLSRSGVILREVAAQTYATSESKGAKRPLPEILGIKEKNRDAAIELAADQLGRSITYSVTSRTNVVRVNVQAEDPLLAQEIAQNVLAGLQDWAATQGHNQAVQERQFIDQQLAEARAKMDQAEEAVRNFLQVNRQYESSPQLKLEHNRLVREVEMRQQLYTAIAQSLEQAKIEEVRSPTLLSVVENADLPVEPQRRRALRKTLTGFAAGLLAGIVFAMLSQRVAEKKAYA